MRFTQNGLFSGHHNNISKRNLQGQIAVIITLVIAAIFLFVMVFINIARVSDVKRQTANLSDKGALRSASGIGSLAHKLKEAEGCHLNWEWIIGLAALIGGFLLGIFVPFSLPASTILMGFGAVIVGQEINTIMKEGITTAFSQSMSTYNGIREGAVGSMITSLQADREYVQREDGTDKFYDEFWEDKDKDGEVDAGEITKIEYDLSGSAILDAINNKKDPTKNKPKIPRFTAWYWAKRYPLVSDESLIEEIAEFVKKLKDLTYYTEAEWDASKWKIKSLSLPVDDISVTSTSPSWVIDWDSVKVVGPVSEGETGKAKGFLMEKFFDLALRLKDKGFDVDICEGGFWSFLPWVSNCPDGESVVEDIRGFLALTLEVLNMPVSQRLSSINQWLPAFYDIDYDHPAGGGDHDIYDRLARVRETLFHWKDELTVDIDSANRKIKPEIQEAHGECTWGRGPGVSSICHSKYGCSTPECGCHCCGSDCSGCCCNICCYPSSKITPCAWQGTYYTCCKNPPVCSNGDLYGAIPSWCATHGNRPNCHSSCPCTVQNFSCDENAKFFQGQLAWNKTAEPTEVEQAVEILDELIGVIGGVGLDGINDAIEEFAQKAKVVLTQNEDLRNEAIYAWKDKGNFCHLARVRINGYPSLEDFPYLSQTRKSLNFLKCLEVEGETEGELKMTVSRYAQEMPTAWWTWRHHKEPEEDEDYVSKTEKIIRVVHNADNLPPEEYKAKLKELIKSEDLSKVLEIAITSETKVHYGPEKEDIKIVKTEGD